VGDVAAEFARRRDAARAAAAGFEPRDLLLANLRLLVAAAALGALAWLAFRAGFAGGGLLLLCVAVFSVLVVLHGRIQERKRRAERVARWAEDALARLDDRWAGAGEPGDRFADDAHLYAVDLDLFGRGSLFERLCAARTRAGQAALARWLAAPVADVRAQQEAVRELVPRLDLREDLAVLGDDAREAVDSDALVSWAEEPPRFASEAPRWIALALGLLAAAALAAWPLGAGMAPFAAVVSVEVLFSILVGPRARRVIAGLDAPGRRLQILAEILGRFERETFESPRLKALGGALGERPSRRIARLARLLSVLDARYNQLIALPYMMLMIGTQAAVAVEAWRRENGPLVRRWIGAAGELEALCSLAGYAYERPGDAFPEAADGPPLFEAERLGHPLLPDAKCVRNDVRLDAARQALVVSGSNMSGKSTLLRTVGVNAALAFAGAPVRAAKLRISRLAVGASIRRLDSLQHGTSRFYAEITRLRELMDAAAKGPLLFLCDELLHGTNSHDRAVGAEAVLRGLVERGAIGLVTTHDLALAKAAEALAPRAANVHFEDHLENGKMAFDYRLRDGVVTKSNAIELMRAVGLRV
jgi:hypothetical protein